jgi:uncharacterized OB-fold protein
MNQPAIRQPHLLTAGPPPRLLGHRCRSCERVLFPPDPFGCERCGATAECLDTVELAAAGTIRAAATVHRHHHPSPETPFTVAVIELDDGPALKSVVLDGGDGDVGRRVVGELVPSAVEEGTLDLRFRLEGTR